MDNDEVFRQFDEIEEKVENLVQVCKTLEATNSDLRVKIEGLERELRDKVEAEKLYTEQKAMVRSKIDSLLTKINNYVEIK